MAASSSRTQKIHVLGRVKSPSKRGISPGLWSSPFHLDRTHLTCEFLLDLLDGACVRPDSRH
jgi:hypothetical protein